MWKAKNFDFQAASTLVNTFLKPEFIPRIDSGFFIVPVIKQDQKNMLPLAFANAVHSYNKNSKVATHITAEMPVPRKSLPAIGRLIFKPAFSGEVVPNANYLLVDDVLTQGGSLNSLKRYIETNGGNIIDITVLAYPRFNESHLAAQNKTRFSITPELVNDILEKRFHNQDLEGFLQKNHIANKVSDLTFSEGAYLKLFSSLSSIERNINIHILSDTLLKKQFFSLNPLQNPDLLIQNRNPDQFTLF